MKTCELVNSNLCQNKNEETGEGLHFSHS